MSPRYILSAAAIIAAAMLTACDDDAPVPVSTDTASPAATSASTVDASIPGAADRATISGRLINGLFPLQAQFLGAVVRRDGLVSPCQAEIPEVIDGDYEIAVMAESEAAGCGAPGAEIILWTYIDETKSYATKAVPWPGDGASTEFNGSFNSATPQGAAPTLTEFSGEAFTAPGVAASPGTRVEAYIRETLCGVGSTRYGDAFSGYILNVIADDSVPGCTPGATITFRIDGQSASESAHNTQNPDIGGGEFTLTVP